MTAPQQSNYGTSGDWSQIISGAGEGASSAIRGQAALTGSKVEKKEAKRRTLANLLNQAMQRRRNLFKSGQDYGDEMSDYQSQALQQVAKGFVEALNGSTRG